MDKVNYSYLLLGGNIEPRLDFIREAIVMIGKNAGNITGMSSVYESEPSGFYSETQFLNCVIRVETILSAGDLLKTILQIENKMGRVRYGEGYSSRTIDIDILYFNRDVLDSGTLIIPHPRLQLRRFVLEPLAEVAPDYKHPVLLKTSNELLKELKDTSEVHVFTVAEDYEV